MKKLIFFFCFLPVLSFSQTADEARVAPQPLQLPADYDYIRDSVPYLRTTDGGNTWMRSAYSWPQSYGAQGIGFVTEQTGWIGGGPGDAHMTTDGGDSWVTTSSVLRSFNRFRKVNNHVAYAVGQRVWKYTNDIVTALAEEKAPEGFGIESISPNPFAEDLELIYHIPQADQVTIRLYDFAGRPAGIVKSEMETAGKHKLHVHIPHYGYPFFSGDQL
jgi:hypothetical protein